MIQVPNSSVRQDAPAPRNVRRLAVILLGAAIPVLLAALVVLLVLAAPRSDGRQLRLDEFQQMVQAGQIQSATFLDHDYRFTGQSDQGAYWVGVPPETVPQYLNELQAAGVAVQVEQEWWKGLIYPLLGIVPTMTLVDVFILVFLLSRQPNAMTSITRSSARRGAGEDIVTFADVAGADEAVEELQELRDYLMNPKQFGSMGARVPKGILVSGPPGCGKTRLARALAGEAGVPFFSISGSDFVELYVGVGAARIRDLFREAKRNAPAIVFIDELDAVGKSRMLVGGQDEREAALNQLLVELDGFDTRTGVVVIAATNRPDILDSALLRPGRFDRRLVVDQPDMRGRAAILRIHARGKPLDEGVDLDQLARRTPGFSGADLANVMNEAALLATRRHRTSVGPAELDEAVDRVVAGPERRSRLLGPRERRVIAFHEAGHALVAARLPGADPVSKISVVSRGYMLGYARSVPDEDRMLISRSQLLTQLAVLHAGRASEELALGEMSSGGQDDLLRATELTRRMVADYGMSERLGPIALRTPDGFGGNGILSLSERTAADVDDEVRVVMQEAHDRAVAILEGERITLQRLVDALVDRETLEGPELAALLAGTNMLDTPIDPAERQAEYK